MLSTWEDSTDLRIHAFNQGKYLVSRRGGKEVVTADPVKQGESRLGGREGGVRANAVDDLPSLLIEELAQMIDDARAGRTVDVAGRRRQ